MTQPTLRSDLPVTYVGHYGSDRLIARRAWVLPPNDPGGERDQAPGWERLLRGMLVHQHGSPFEGGLLDLYLEVPAVVWWQLTRYRFMSLDVEDLSPNLESGRYRVLEGQFYTPPPERPLLEPADFKPLRPELALASATAHREVQDHLAQAYATAWAEYEWFAACGMAREVARLALPFAIYYAGYVSARPATWLHFFGQRLRGLKVASFPQWEIEQVAQQIAAIFAEHWPITYKVFREQVDKP